MEGDVERRVAEPAQLVNATYFLVFLDTRTSRRWLLHFTSNRNVLYLLDTPPNESLHAAVAIRAQPRDLLEQRHMVIPSTDVLREQMIPMKM